MLWLAGCGSTPNGDPCDSNSDCASSFCEGNICNSGKCPQPGAGCGDADDWECVQNDTLFGSYNSCKLLCADAEPKCPDWYSCLDDKHCEYASVEITYSPTELVANLPVTFTAHFFADRPREMASWLFDMNGSAVQAQGETATVMFPSPGAVRAGFIVKYANEATPYQAAIRLTIH